MALVTSLKVVVKYKEFFVGYSGVLELINGFLDESPKWTITKAALRLYYHLLDHLRERQPERSISSVEFNRIMEFAAEWKHIRLIRWLHTNMPDMEPSTNVIDAAAVRGQLESVQWLHENYPNIRCTTRAMDGAAGRGDINMVKWLHENRSEGCTEHGVNSAMEHGHLEVVKFILSNRRERYTLEGIYAAKRCGRYDMLNWIARNRELRLIKRSDATL